ncbi:MAG: SRPBCC family protein [Vulcanimicrobiaceae bacterium]
MKNIELHIELPIPAAAAHDETMALLGALGRSEPPFEDLALALGLRSLHFPIAGEVRIPIATHVELAPVHWEATLEINSADHPNFFPRFRGTMTLNALDTNKSELSLQGSYIPPIGSVGDLIDATILHGAAERSLRDLLERIAQLLLTTIRTREEATARRARGLR